MKSYIKKYGEGVFNRLIITISPLIKNILWIVLALFVAWFAINGGVLIGKLVTHIFCIDFSSYEEFNQNVGFFMVGWISVFLLMVFFYKIYFIITGKR